ncbi:GNAT family N-acetyltransferase [Vibrio sp. 10N.261.55.A7]|uniref:GNAT family N-acetyltransferase n=1 Tax=Vibrio sp. 10N.261.55.A7 TaxID=1880851 RepID=UPI000C82224D|nr:GNAT family N-acetyltransferase [Vibrio sp. 10N.261.55.A7]PMJ92773.1 GNAT family N-acetyltransferase [Vibrio sp. 10N.261.55.A7]
MTPLTIRPAVKEDSETIFHFIKELAIYEKAEHEVHATVETIKDTIFSEHSHVNALICQQGEQPIGMAIYFYNYSTWLAKPGLFLEDLYVSQECRGIGAGKRLLKEMARIALEQGCGRFEWNCLDWNTPSRDFYESIGAESQDEWIGYRMSGKSLIDFAEQP